MALAMREWSSTETRREVPISDDLGTLRPALEVPADLSSASGCRLRVLASRVQRPSCWRVHR